MRDDGIDAFGCKISAVPLQAMTGSITTFLTCCCWIICAAWTILSSLPNMPVLEHPSDHLQKQRSFVFDKRCFHRRYFMAPTCLWVHRDDRSDRGKTKDTIFLKCFKSASIPAPPVESDPAIDRTFPSSSSPCAFC